MCAGQPYGIPRIGEPDDLTEITAKSLYAHYRDLLATSRVELFYMGSLSPEAVTKVLQTALAELPRAEVFVPVGTTPAPQARPVQEKTERLDVTQGKAQSRLFYRHYSKGPALSRAGSGGDGLRRRRDEQALYERAREDVPLLLRERVV